MLSPVTGLPFASVTVAVAVDVEVPSAVMRFGLRATVTAAALPTVWVNVLVPDTAGETCRSVAVIVETPAAPVEVMVAW
jgi:hypothetical protein